MFQDVLMAIGGGCFGFLIGTIWKAQSSKTQRRVQQELWDRKFRLAEADREAAVATLNQNNIDVKKIRSTFEGHKTQIQQLSGQTQEQEKLQRVLETELDQREEAVESLQGAVRRLEAEATNAHAESKRKTNVFRELSDVNESMNGKLEMVGTELTQLGEELTTTHRQLDEAIETRDARITELESGHAQALKTRVRTITELEGRVAELAPFPERLTEAEAGMAYAIGEAAQQRERLTTLEPLPERLVESEVQLADTRRRLAETQESTEERRIELETRVAELEPLSDELRARDEELARLRELLIELDPVPARLKEREQQLEKSRAQHRDYVDKKKTELAELRRQVTSLAVLPDQIGRAKENLEATKGELQELDKQRRREIEGLKRVLGALKPLPKQLEERDADLAVWQAKYEELEQKAGDAGQKHAGRIARLESEIQEAKLNAKTFAEGQRRLQKSDHELFARDKKIDTLNARLATQKVELTQFRKQAASLSAVSQSGQVKQHGLETELKELNAQLMSTELKLMEAQRIEKSAAKALGGAESKVARLEKAAAKASGAPVPKKPTPAKTEAPKKAPAKRPIKNVTIKPAPKPDKKATPKRPTIKTGDNLQHVNGIGPGYAKALKAIGIKSFKQIAAIDTAKKLQNLAAKIDVQPERIKRGKWVQKAKQAHFKKYRERI